MKKILPVLILPLVYALGGCSGAPDKGEAVTLSFRFPAGAEYIYATDSRQTITQQMAGLNSEIRQNMQLQSTYKVGRAGNGNKRLTVVYDRFYVRSSSNGMTMEYDSRDSSKQPQELQGAGSMVDRPFSIIIDSLGTILKVDHIAARTEDSGSISVPDPFSDSTIRQMMEQSLNIYPDRPVRTGDTWQRKYVTNIGFMDMEVASIYKLISISNGIAHIEISAKIKSMASRHPEMQSMQLEMSGTQTGTMDIDIKTGLIQDSRFVQDVAGKMRIPGTEIPMKLTSDTRMIGTAR